MSSALSMPHRDQSSRISGRRSFRPSDARIRLELLLAFDAAVLRYELHHEIDVEALRVQRGNGVPVAFLPVLQDVAVQAAGPPDPALQESEVKHWKPMRNPAEKQRFAHSLTGCGEVADMVIHVVGHRAPAAPALAAGVGRRRHAQLQAPLPERIVVVVAVQSQGVDVAGEGRQVRPCFRYPRDGAVHVGDHDGLEAQLADGVFGVLDGLFRGVGGNHCGRGHPVRAFAVEFRVELVQRPAGNPAQLLILEPGRPGQTLGGIEHREVEAQPIHSLVQQPRQRRRGPVQGVARRPRPPGRAMRPDAAPLSFRHGGPAAVGAGARGLGIAPRHVGAAQLLEIVEVQRRELDGVAVGIDDRMVEPGANGFGFQCLS